MARLLRLGLPVILAALAIGLIFWIPSTDELSKHIQRTGLAGPIVFILGAAAMMSLITPKTVVSVAAGAMFGTLLGSFVMLITSLLAAMINFVVGRWWLAGTIDRRLQSILNQEPSGRGEAFQIACSIAKEAGFGLHLLIRLCPVPTFLVSYAMGACGAKWKPFLAAVAVAVIPQVLWVHSGTAAGMVGQSDSSRLAWLGVATSLVGGIAISVVLPRVAMKRLRERQFRSKLC